jgi:hypothetical protein
MSAIRQAITPNSHTNLLNVYKQIAHKMGFQQKKWIICKNSVRSSQETHYDPTAATSRLIASGETVAAYCENHTNTQIYCFFKY